jgi:hypothetical protein
MGKGEFSENINFTQVIKSYSYLYLTPLNKISTREGYL